MLHHRYRPNVRFYVLKMNSKPICIVRMMYNFPDVVIIINTIIITYKTFVKLTETELIMFCKIQTKIWHILHYIFSFSQSDCRNTKCTKNSCTGQCNLDSSSCVLKKTSSIFQCLNNNVRAC